MIQLRFIMTTKERKILKYKTNKTQQYIILLNPSRLF